MEIILLINFYFLKENPLFLYNCKLFSIVFAGNNEVSKLNFKQTLFVLFVNNMFEFILRIIDQ